MKVDFMAFADFAATDPAGKMTIVGLFDRINTLAPQVQVPIIAIPIRFRAEAADPTGRPLKIQLRAKGPDNSVLLQLDAEVTLSGMPPGVPIESVTLPMPFIGQNIVFPRHGAYVFEIWIDKTRAAQTILMVGPPLSPPVQAAS